MKAATLYRWSVVHTWSSLVCTLFLLAICLTGLPLIFSSEIERLSDTGPPFLTPVTPRHIRFQVDAIIGKARQAFPNDIIRSVYWPDDRPVAIVRLAPSDDADNALDHTMTFDAQTGDERQRDPETHTLAFMEVMSHIHEDLFLGLSGELFLGLMALIFLVAIGSGVVLYAPFMRHVEFGTRRGTRGSRVAWLDLHNVLSAVALCWMAIVGLTGVINEIATPLFVHWLNTEVNQDIVRTSGQTLPAKLAPVSSIMQAVAEKLPEQKIESVDFPTHHFGSPTQFIVWTKGETPLTSRLDIPTFVDAGSGRFAKSERLPWYLLLLEISRPLHFGDYGGLPLKILWAIFDVLTVIVLISGIWLWVARRRVAARRRANLSSQAAELSP